MGLGVGESGEGEEGIVRNWPRKRLLSKENMNKMECEMNVLSNWDIRIRLVYNLYIRFGTMYWLIKRKGLKAVAQEAAITRIFESHDTAEGSTQSDPEPTFHQLLAWFGIAVVNRNMVSSHNTAKLPPSAEIALIDYTNV